MFAYFTFFSVNIGGLVLNFSVKALQSDDTLEKLCRFSFLTIGHCYCIVFALLVCTLSYCHAVVTDNLGKIMNLVAAFYMFFIQPILYLRYYGKSNTFQMVISIIELFVGVGTVAFLFYFDFKAV